ncbi:MAG: membrane dipeptidase [Prevotella sp.]|jgi:membrane dipeptidase
MNQFDIESHLKEFYAAFPSADHQPIIGITSNYEDGDITLRERYCMQLVKAGATPVIIPPIDDKAAIINTLEHIDGLVLTGGGDINPLWSGEEPAPELHNINAKRDLPELLITRLAYNRQIPILGICRGMQMLAVALGGKVAQDMAYVSSTLPNVEGHPRRIKHSQDADKNQPTHTVKIVPGSHLAEIYSISGNDPAREGGGKEAEDTTESVRMYDISTEKGGGKEDDDTTESIRMFDLNTKKDGAKEADGTTGSVRMFDLNTEKDGEKEAGDIVIAVNSFHHQVVSAPGNRFHATATAPDGVIEAMESSEFKPIMGVQWHPEWLEEEGLKLFKWLAAQATDFHRAKQLHDRMLTLDSHCDTPMFFPQGVKFDHRDPRILYDLHKMHEGRQDAVVMVAYLPQPKTGESFAQKVDIAGIIKHNPHLKGISTQLSPTEYADLIFDKLEEIVNENSLYINTARTPNDLYENKRGGRKSIMFGIENGLALGHDLSNVHHFAQRGVVYITLCHNGDNDICDSARGENTHHGVSPFGEKVIQRMNDEGVMVDLSHGAEKSFYDALDISRTPIVCSHSNARALCDVPRNLTDDQMRALAQKDGVAQITLYHGFLRQQGEATIMDAIAHLEHAISIMGIDHVGIGTDFDGDGTVRGCADASELINFTLHLMRRKYSEQDIAKIWGGNWLRVMSMVQASKKALTT